MCYTEFIHIMQKKNFLFLRVKFTQKQFRLSKTPILSLRNRRTH